jgi:hypothetical protein
MKLSNEKNACEPGRTMNVLMLPVHSARSVSLYQHNAPNVQDLLAAMAYALTEFEDLAIFGRTMCGVKGV